jgi:tetratricopeptide (TPR) repeat protein
LDRAIALDDEFSLAYASKASIYSGQLINSAVGSTLGWAELEPRVRENARKALELDPKSGLALNALGDLASYSWRWSAAQESYDQALEGGFALGSGSAYWFRSWSGERAEALRIAQQMVAVNPRDWFAHFVYGIVLHYARDYDAAAAAFRDGIALAAASPLPHLWLAFTETARGDPEEAKRELELTEQLLGENRVMIVLVGLVYGYGRVGDLDNARRVFDEITAIADRGEDIGAGGWASAHLAVGHLDEALEWLQRGVEKATRHEPDTGYYSLMNIRMNATNDPVLERPEFVDVRDRLRGD